MKRIILMVILCLALTTVLATPVLAAGKWVDAQRVPLYPTAYGNSDMVYTDQPSQGEVVFVDPMGNVTFIIQGNVLGLTPNQEYSIWIRDLRDDPGYTGTFIVKYAPLGYYMLDTFTTNDEGRGKFHLNIRAEDLSAGTFHIQLAINEWFKGGWWGTVLATEKYITVTIKS